MGRVRERSASITSNSRGDEPLYGMARGRALLTDTEREQIAGEHGKQRKYEAVARVRARIRDELTKDIELFEEHKPELVEELQEVACQEE
jgi:hypothetical protein